MLPTPSQHDPLSDHAPRRERRVPPGLDQVDDVPVLALAVVLPPQGPEQHPVGEDEQAPRGQEGGALDGDGGVGGGGPHGAVLHGDRCQAREEAREGVQRQGQVDAVEEPDMVAPPAQGQVGGAEGAEAEEGRGHGEEGHRGDAPPVLLLGLVGGGGGGGRW